RLTASLCDEVEDGQVRSYNLGSAGPVAEEDWDEALAAVQDITGGHGFSDVTPVVDAPGDHLVDLDRPDGARTSFGTKDATILRVTTGCHPASPASPASPAGPASTATPAER